MEDTPGSNRWRAGESGDGTRLRLVGGPSAFLTAELVGRHPHGPAQDVFFGEELTAQTIRLRSSDGRLFLAQRISWRSGKATGRRLNLLLAN
jgi:hypothetical protein